MKKLLFGLIATIMFGFVGNAQKITKESVRYGLSEEMVSLVNALKPAYKNGAKFTDFERVVIGTSKNTNEGSALLKKVYEYTKMNTSREEILKSYSGVEMAAACLYMNDVYKKNPKSDGSDLFGGTTGDFNPYPATIQGKSAPCAWYQLGCWAGQIFGEAGGTAIITAVVTWLVTFLMP